MTSTASATGPRPEIAPRSGTEPRPRRGSVFANADPRSWDTRLIAEMAMALALAVVLGPLFTMILPLRMPQGGSVSLEMLPILFVAIRRGLVPGVIVGGLFGCAELLPVFAPFTVSPLQVLLDYPLAFAAVGLAGLVGVPVVSPPPLGVGRTRQRLVRFVAPVVAAVFVGALARFGCHFLSGIVFFSEYAPEGQAVWLYSLIYNGAFMLPEAVITCTALVFLLPYADAAGLSRQRRGL
jgi:thiamine transporter